ncbi:hypothetical protein C8R44DRAFT_724828 [Mycena epipterygia]|nr:hypothetical protein C8R44DRAFT_724828 [Mycena epipterygia]
MPSEPLEAEFVHPPALSESQEEELRQLELEGPLPPPFPQESQTATKVGSLASIRDLEAAFTKDGTGEDPREWGRARKWFTISDCQPGRTRNLATCPVGDVNATQSLFWLFEGEEGPHMLVHTKFWQI